MVDEWLHIGVGHFGAELPDFFALAGLGLVLGGVVGVVHGGGFMVG